MATITIPSSVSSPRGSGILSGPLSVLYSGKAPITKLNYPLELGTDISKSHYVQFALYKVTPGGYSDVRLTAPGVANFVNAAIPLVTAGTNQITNIAANFAVNNAANIKAAGAKVISEGTKGLEQIANGLKTGIPVSAPLQNLGAMISLYMPDTMDSRYSAEYTDIELTSELGKIITTLRTVDHVITTANKAGPGAMRKASALSIDPTVIKAAIEAASGYLKTGANLPNVLLQGQGYAINPQLQMIYKGLPLRSFSLSFIFTPKSRKEADVVNQIIHLFKYHSLPSLEQGKSTSIDSMFLTPPSVFEIFFYNKGVENIYLPKYDKCVLESIDVDDAPNGWAAHVDGSPVQRRLTLQFKELSILHKDKIGTTPDLAKYR
jgi:Tail-tube assembly protein